VLFIGTQFSILYTSMYSPAGGSIPLWKPLGRVSSPPSLSCFFVLFSHAIFCNEECYGKRFQQSPNVDWGSHGYG
jgi:hypothetical protein